MKVEEIKYRFEDNVDWKIYCNKNEHKQLVYDLVQKINYTVQDLNNEIQYLDNPTMKEIIYVITLVCWLDEALNKLINYGCSEYTKDINKGNTKKEHDFLWALRSFVLAHPTDTFKHSKYGLDGSKICVDVREASVAELSIDYDRSYTLGIEGLVKNPNKIKGDYYLSIYSSEDNYESMFYVVCSINELYDIAQLYIDIFCLIETHISSKDI